MGSQETLASGVRMVHCMRAKRSTKKGAARGRMRWSGWYQATKCSGLRPSEPAAPSAESAGSRGEGVGLVHRVGFDLAEADEGVHLVEVAADLLLECAELSDVGVDLDLEEVAGGLEAEEDAVEEVPAVGRAVDGGDLCGFEEGLRGVGCGDGEAGGAVVGFGGVEGQEECGGDGCVLEIEVFGSVALLEEGAGVGAPVVEVGLDEDVLHRCSLDAWGRRACECR